MQFVRFFLSFFANICIEHVPVCVCGEKPWEAKTAAFKGESFKDSDDRQMIEQTSDGV